MSSEPRIDKTPGIGLPCSQYFGNKNELGFSVCYKKKYAEFDRIENVNFNRHDIQSALIGSLSPHFFHTPELSICPASILIEKEMIDKSGITFLFKIEIKKALADNLSFCMHCRPDMMFRESYVGAETINLIPFKVKGFKLIAHEIKIG